MPIPTVPSWALNDPVTSTKLQAMCTAISYLLYRGHGTYGQTGTAQSINNDTPPPIAWNSNVRQYLVTHSTVPNNTRVTPNEPGLWVCLASVQLTGDADGYRKLWFQQNGSGSATEGSVQASDVAELDPIGPSSAMFGFEST